ncbi:MAG: helix-turn-helix domain-containing protein [Nocardioidaceae bacterium]
MSTEQVAEAVPEWDTADRMRKALRASGVPVQQMADYLGVARNTVSTWINGKIKPSTQTLRLWALRTGVSYDWLTGGGGESVRRGGLEPSTRCYEVYAADVIHLDPRRQSRTGRATGQVAA